MKKSPAPAAKTSSSAETDELVGFDTLKDAVDAVREYLADDGTIELHEDGCDGECDGACGVQTFKASEIYPKVLA
jgi:hypothetical protein